MFGGVASFESVLFFWKDCQEGQSQERPRISMDKLMSGCYLFVDVTGPRPVLQKAFELGLIANGHDWMQMVKSRNATVHTYDEQKAREIILVIRSCYHQLFLDLAKRLRQEVKV
jgi:hypothetical protein